MVSTVHIGLCDNLNPGFGYQIEIVNTHGVRVLFTSRDPATGAGLDTLSDALRVASYYAPKADRDAAKEARRGT